MSRTCDSCVADRGSGCRDSTGSADAEPSTGTFTRPFVDVGIVVVDDDGDDDDDVAAAAAAAAA